MKNTDEQTDLNNAEQLVGIIERVTYHNPENGFCVLRAKIRGHRDLVTVTGFSASITAGEHIESQGSWFNDKKHGMQFKAQSLKVIPPTTTAGILKYLSSGLIKGIGQHFAGKLVDAFGDKVFDVIENDPARLMQLPGIGKKRLQGVIDAWKEQKIIREIMVFLQSHGIGTARAVRIYKTYGDLAIDIVRENPYRLALDIFGIGFKTSDQLALRLGIAKDALIRARAGCHHVLYELCNQGHCAVFMDQLIEKSTELLEIPEAIIKQAIQYELDSENLIMDTIDDKACLYAPHIYHAEVGISQELHRLASKPIPWPAIDAEKAIAWVEKQSNMQLSVSQQEAIRTAIANKVTIITGGPGVGKTTVVNSILMILRAKRLHVSLAAPTGRAAKRMTETTQLEAKTIHRLLEYDPRTRGFKHDADNPLVCDYLIIDETSMLDTQLMNHLLKAVPSSAGLLLVGDVDQLPSVGSGNVLADIIASETVSTIRLTEIFRQASTSNIIVNAHLINQGKMPISSDTHDNDCYCIYRETPEEIAATVMHLITERIPEKFGFDHKNDIQVLTPMNRGGLGTRALNEMLQRKLNAHGSPQIQRFGMTYAPGDKVIQNINNYDKEVFNGDIGIIRHIDTEAATLLINFEKRDVTYEFNDLDEISLAYAISIHKSQGSEYPAIVIPLATQHYSLLARNLLYTAMTRGKRLVILVAQKKAVGMAVSNDKTRLRLTHLKKRLCDRFNE